jgi:hypothetical protein
MNTNDEWRIMPNIRTLLLRWSIASVFMLAVLASSGSVQGAEVDTPPAVAGPGAAPILPIASPCAFTSPCIVEHSSDGWELQYGGPSQYFDRIGDE